MIFVTYKYTPLFLLLSKIFYICNSYIITKFAILSNSIPLSRQVEYIRITFYIYHVRKFCAKYSTSIMNSTFSWSSLRYRAKYAKAS
nr:MAG TPA: hypothetical protein [Caudoviricetes sp.]